MITTKKLKCISIAIFCPMLIGLQVNSTVCFRLKLADFYKSNRQYVKTIQLYNKILTKNSVKRNLGKETISKINFDLGYLYAKLDLTNLAIESYAKGNPNLKNVGIDNYYLGDNLEKDKLLAIGLLEAGRWNRAIKEFRKLEKLYPQFQDAEKYINAAISLEKQNVIRHNKNLFFSIGDAYVQNQLFEEAKSFFTKRVLDYGLHPLEVLKYLSIEYVHNADIREKVWGDTVYVVLEDFENIYPQLNRWLIDVKSRVDAHCIVKDVAYGGKYSEFLDITYTKRGYDYWVKATDIPLNDSSLNLGISLLVKTLRPQPCNLGFNVIYGTQEDSGVYTNFNWQDMNNGWQEYRIDNLFKKTKEIALRRNWDMKNILIDRIIFNTQGISNKFYVDNIKLYLRHQP